MAFTCINMNFKRSVVGRANLEVWNPKSFNRIGTFLDTYHLGPPKFFLCLRHCTNKDNYSSTLSTEVFIFLCIILYKNSIIKNSLDLCVFLTKQSSSWKRGRWLQVNLQMRLYQLLSHPFKGNKTLQRIAIFMTRSASG